MAHPHSPPPTPRSLAHPPGAPSRIKPLDEVQLTTDHWKDAICAVLTTALPKLCKCDDYFVRECWNSVGGDDMMTIASCLVKYSHTQLPLVSRWQERNVDQMGMGMDRGIGIHQLVGTAAPR